MVEVPSLASTVQPVARAKAYCQAVRSPRLTASNMRTASGSVPCTKANRAPSMRSGCAGFSAAISYR